MTAVVRQDALPDFEDGLVELSQIRITNAGDGLSEALKIAPRALHIDDEVAILIRGRVTQVNHRKKDSRDGEDDTIVRVHTVKALAATEIEMEHAKKILVAAADNLARRKAELEGQMQIEADEDLEGAEALKTIEETGKLAPEFKA